mmetsp:Transcript_63045/g.169417  ORF Transcript_63045/g.169417 Transcript_63045/m.169417 type:complete len:216 (+) Transcript_63045:777-1424(+)
MPAWPASCLRTRYLKGFAAFWRRVESASRRASHLDPSRSPASLHFRSAPCVRRGPLDCPWSWWILRRSRRVCQRRTPRRSSCARCPTRRCCPAARWWSTTGVLARCRIASGRACHRWRRRCSRGATSPFGPTSCRPGASASPSAAARYHPRRRLGRRPWQPLCAARRASAWPRPRPRQASPPKEAPRRRATCSRVQCWVAATSDCRIEPGGTRGR